VNPIPITKQNALKVLHI